MCFFGNLVLSCTLCFYFVLHLNGGAPSDKGILQYHHHVQLHPLLYNSSSFWLSLQSILHTFSFPLQNLSHFSGVFLGWVFVAESGPPTPGLTHFTLARVIRSLGIPVRSLGYQNSNVFTSFNWSFKLLENYHFWCNRKRRAYRRCQILCSSTT